MGKNIIVSEETIRDLLEAHASLAAWYYELSAALRAAHGVARSPDDATRSAFVERLATDFPELAAIAKTIRVPRMFVPPPPALGTRPLEEGTGDEQSTLIEPAAARFKDRDSSQTPPPAAGVPASGVPAAVDPDKVKY